MSAGPRFAFLTHGGPAIGLGHVGRCLSLARALATADSRQVFLLGRDSRVTDVVEAAGFDAVETNWESAGASARHLVAALRPEVLVVDSYAVSSDVFDSLRAEVGRLVAIDDAADRALPVHTVVNGGAGAEALAYRGGLPDTAYLLGPRYALLDPSYAAAPSRKTRRSVERVLVTVGGGSHEVALDAVVRAALALDAAAVDVVLGPFAGDGMSGALDDPRVVVHRGASALRPLMLAADVAVSGAGMTLLELAATATPTFFVTLAPNQEPNASAFERACAALPAGSPAAPDFGAAVALHLKRLAGDAAQRESLGASARRLVDGQGALRVAQALAAGTPR
jgi:UDP-2,4-diacetamido-2,4,6-trideoxy-beta-L-altropyranose hydrolase